MKLLRLSLLLTLFSNKTTQSKFLKFINIGIFLSIFAISSAFITFIIETKIDNIEYDLLEIHKEKRSTQKVITDLTTLQSQYTLVVNGGKTVKDLYEFIGSTKLGEYTISVKDLYLPSIFAESDDTEWFSELSDEGTWSAINKLFSDWFGKDSEEFKKYIKSHEKINKYALKSKNIDYSKYYDDIYNFDANKIRDEIISKDSINYFDDEIYENYLEIQKVFPDIITLLKLMNEYYTGMSLNYEEFINEQNNEIVKLSKLESRTIILAFIFQFIVFLIIQYFEINSIQTQKKRNAKRVT